MDKITKNCSACKEDFPLTNEFWFKDIRIKIGFSSQCKPCNRKRINIQARRARDLRCKAKNRDKERSREIARNHYKEKMAWLNCSVLGCHRKADDLHHIDYKQPLSVIPLCKRHHADNHSV